MSSRHVVLSGCSGGGKSTLLLELARRGFATVPEPGRRIVEDEQRDGGLAMPWIDLGAFAARAVELAAEDRGRMAGTIGWIFFDRGLVDAAVALQHATGRPARDALAPFERYHRCVFMTPPWPEIYVTDRERQHDLAEAISEYDRLLIAYRELGYTTLIVPKLRVEDRAEFILRHLGA